MKKKLIVSLLITLLVLANLGVIVQASSANIKLYTYTTEENVISSEKILNIGTVQYSMPSPVYDFIDENGDLNVVYTSENNVYWDRFNENMEREEVTKFQMYFDYSTIPEYQDYLKDLVRIFGNALYYDGYLYIMYGRKGTDAQAQTSVKEATMALVKYDKQGNIVGKTEFIGAQNSSNTDWNYGTYIPFFPNSNCSLTISNGIIGCFFGKQMYISHSASNAIYVDAETMEWVSNQYFANDEDKKKYDSPRRYYNSHSMAQRIIGTSDGGYILVDSADASLRGLLVTKVYPDENGILQSNRQKMIHYREGSMGSNGYNNTYMLPGNIIELSDGYLYVGAMEKTLDRGYGNPINESWNIVVQKYTKDFYTKDSVEAMQMFNAPVRETEGTPPEDTSLGRVYLDGTEKDYGLKFLTDLNNEKTVTVVRAVELENDRVAILYELMDLEDSSVGGYNTKSRTEETYYMIVNGEGEIVEEPRKIEGVSLTQEEILPYHDGKIYWTSTEEGGNKIVVNVLDITNPVTLLKGDVNRDGVVGLYDAFQILRTVILGDGDLSEGEQYIMDFNDDGEVGLYDAFQFLRQVILR